MMLSDSVQEENLMNTNRLQRSLLAFVCSSLLLLGAACGTSTPQTPVHTPSGSAIANSSTTPRSTPTPSGKPETPTSGGAPATVPMPPTQTDCPPQGIAGRAAVMRPLALGNHPNIAYIFNEGTSDNPTFAELRRYDVTTASKTVIVHLPKTHIAEAQVSADGQWLLFVNDIPEYAPTAGVSALQMVRMDGQGLQTLYCASFGTLQGVQWSPDQKFVVFSLLYIPGELVMLLLNISSGSVQLELKYPDTSFGYLARTWPDTTHVYVVGVPNTHNGPVLFQSLYMLDTGKGANQHPNDLVQVLTSTQPQSCWDFDSDYHATKLVTSSCTVFFPPVPTDRGVQQGPSTMSVLPITGGQGHTIFTSPNLAVAQVRLQGYSSNSLLLTIENQNYGANFAIDTSQNGLWKMNTDGSGLTRLTTEDSGNTSNLNLFTQYPWSNISPDGSMYALQVTNIQSKDPITTLVFGELGGGEKTAFALAHVNSGNVEVAGWTNM